MRDQSTAGRSRPHARGLAEPLATSPTTSKAPQQLAMLVPLLPYAFAPAQRRRGRLDYGAQLVWLASLFVSSAIELVGAARLKLTCRHTPQRG